MRKTRRDHRSDHTESSARQLVRILVSGDFVEITHSFAFPGEPASRWHQLVDNLWPSGASFLAEVVEQFVAAASGSASVTLDPTGSDWPLSVNLEWNPFAKCIGKSGSVWRAGKAFATSRPLVAFAGLDESLLEPAAPAPPCEMLIVDDQGFGFRDANALWPDALDASAFDLEQIIFKSSDSALESSLGKHLLAHHAEKLILVVSIEDLRRAGSPIPRSRSWETILEELAFDLQERSERSPLLKPRQVVIAFPGSAIAVIENAADAGSTITLAFDPSDTEGAWISRRPGMTLGLGTLITGTIVASLVQHRSLDDLLPRVMAYSRWLHETGVGQGRSTELQGFDLVRLIHEFNIRGLQAAAFVMDSDATNDAVESDKNFQCVSIPLVELLERRNREASWSLASAARDTLRAPIYEVGVTIVHSGPRAGLRNVPHLKVGDYYAIGRNEIDQLSEIRSLLHDYSQNRDKKPFALAVFAPPGTGKSFAVEQLTKEALGFKPSMLKFNLSQMNPQDRDVLHAEFNAIRDASVHGDLPIVLWDEFDAEDWKWLRWFLGPIQDAEYVSAGRRHPIGKCVFVFAGSTCHSSADFKQKDTENAFALNKGPDFRSRLKGYFDVPSINLGDGLGDDDYYALRRALLIRAFLAKYHPDLVDEEESIDIDAEVLHALLNVRRYRYGARSLEQVVSLSVRLAGERFEKSILPSRAILSNHLDTESFYQLLNRG